MKAAYREPNSNFSVLQTCFALFVQSGYETVQKSQEKPGKEHKNS